MSGVWRKTVLVARWLFAGEHLPEAPREPGGTKRRRPTFWGWVGSASELPEHDRTTPERTPRGGFLSWLARRETCPEVACDRRQRRPGQLRRLLAAEECPQEAERAPRRRTGFWRWLWSKEEL